jgi:MFS family permease
MSHELPPPLLEKWGWRLSFLMSALIAAAALFFRRHLHETRYFQNAKEFGHLDKEPLFDTFHKYKYALLHGIGLLVLETVGFNLMILFSSVYFQQAVHLPLNQVTIIQLVTIALLLIVTPLAGKASIYLGSKRLAKWAVWGMLLTVFPIYYLISSQILWVILICHGILAVLLATYLGNLPALTCALFPVEVRYSGVATAMNLSITIFASIGIVIITLLINTSSSYLWPSLYWIGGALLSLWSLSKVKEKR